MKYVIYLQLVSFFLKENIMRNNISLYMPAIKILIVDILTLSATFSYYIWTYFFILLFSY